MPFLVLSSHTINLMSTNRVFALLWVTLSTVVQANDMSTFDEVRAKYKAYRDPTRVSYLYNRCAALQLNVAALLQRKGQQEGAQNFQDMAQHYMVLSEANEREIDKKRGIKSKETMKTVNRNVANVSEVYSDRMNRNFAQRREYIVGDKQLESELAECNTPEVFKKKVMAQ